MKRLFGKNLLIILGLAIVGVLVWYFSGAKEFFTLATLRQNQELLLGFVQNHYILAPLVYMLSFVIVVTATLPIALFVTLVGGFLFGFWWGLLFTLVSSTLGATFSFWAIRHLFGEALQERYHARLADFNQNIEQYGSFYLLGLHFVGFLPFFLINTLAALTGVSTFTFVWTTVVGVLPIFSLFTYMGQKLGTISSLKDVLSPQITLAFIALGLFCLAPVIWGKISKRLR